MYRLFLWGIRCDRASLETGSRIQRTVKGQKAMGWIFLKFHERSHTTWEFELSPSKYSCLRQDERTPEGKEKEPKTSILRQVVWLLVPSYSSKTSHILEWAGDRKWSPGPMVLSPRKTRASHAPWSALHSASHQDVGRDFLAPDYWLTGSWYPVSSGTMVCGHSWGSSL